MQMPKPTALINGAAFPEQHEPKLTTAKYSAFAQPREQPISTLCAEPDDESTDNCSAHHPWVSETYLTEGSRMTQQRFEGRRSVPAS